MSITIATVVLNAADALALTLESAALQTHRDREILVIDGASWDDTPAVLARYRTVVDRIETIEDDGVYGAMNAAAALASKAFILFMNAGDLFHTAHALEKLWTRRSAAADIVYGDHIHRHRGVDTLQIAGDFERRRQMLRRGEVPPSWPATFPGHQATLIRTALLQRLGFDTAFRIAADHEFLLRAAEQGAQIEYVDDIISHYVGGGLSAQRPELVRLELNAIYRGHTLRPAAIDARFYGANSPFRGLPTPLSGTVAGGLIADGAAGTPDGAPAIDANEALFISPSEDVTEGMTLAGRNAGGPLRLAAKVADVSVGSAAIDPGPFSCDLLFDAPVEPASAISLAPCDGGAGSVKATIADWSFVFQEDAAKVESGDVLTFSRSEAGTSQRYMEAGWHGFDGAHAWTREKTASLRLASEAPIAELQLLVRANPALAEQRLEVRLNRTVVHEGQIGGVRERWLTIATGHAWRGRGIANRLFLTVSAVARVGADPRALGVALAELRLR